MVIILFSRCNKKLKDCLNDFNIPKTQRRPPGLTLEEKQRSLLIIHNEDIVTMYATDEYSYSQIAIFLTYISQKLERLHDQQKQIMGKQAVVAARTASLDPEVCMFIYSILQNTVNNARNSYILFVQLIRTKK